MQSVSALVANNSIDLGASPERIQIINNLANNALPNIRRYITPHYVSQESQKDY